LNLPEDWEGLFAEDRRRQRHETKRKEKLVRDGIREGIRDAAIKIRKRHEVEMERSARRLREEREIAEAGAAKEAARLRNRLARELGASHREETEAAECRFEEERRRFEAEIRRLEDEARRAVEDTVAFEEMEEAETARAARRNLKPMFEVGEEVYASSSSSSSSSRRSDEEERRGEADGWCAGRIKGYREVERDDDAAEVDGGDAGERRDRQEGDYGPVRLYHVKYDEDGAESVDVPEHLVFPKADYLLLSAAASAADSSSTSSRSAPDKSWKGVRNVVDPTSPDRHASLVGWYVATLDGREVPFARLSDALGAYDACVARRRGDRTKRSELNLPREWEWLWRDGGGDDVVVGERTSSQDGKKGGGERERTYDDGEVRERIKAEKEKLKVQLTRRHDAERDDAARRCVEERDVAVKAAIREAVQSERRDRKEMEDKFRRDLADDYERRRARLAKEAMEEARVEINAVTKKAWESRDRHVEKARMELQQQFLRDKEKAVHWLRIEMQQHQQVELVKLRAELERSLGVESLVEVGQRQLTELTELKSKLLQSEEEHLEMQESQESELDRLEAILLESVELMRDDAVDSLIPKQSNMLNGDIHKHGNVDMAVSVDLNVTSPYQNEYGQAEQEAKENMPNLLPRGDAFGSLSIDMISPLRPTKRARLNHHHNDVAMSPFAGNVTSPNEQEVEENLPSLLLSPSPPHNDTATLGDNQQHQPSLRLVGVAAASSTTRHLPSSHLASGTEYNSKQQLPPPPAVGTDTSHDIHPHFTRSKGKTSHSKRKAVSSTKKDQSAGENTTEGKTHRKLTFAASGLSGKHAAMEENDNAQLNAHQHAIDALLGAAEEMVQQNQFANADDGVDGVKPREEMGELCTHLLLC